MTHVFVVHSDVFFFFQAEDGIRDTSVTGVQTCALPISRSMRHGLHWLARESAWRIERADDGDAKTGEAISEPLIRSEERREGKSVDLAGRRTMRRNITES